MNAPVKTQVINCTPKFLSSQDEGETNAEISETTLTDSKEESGDVKIVLSNEVEMNSEFFLLYSFLHSSIHLKRKTFHNFTKSICDARYDRIPR